MTNNFFDRFNPFGKKDHSQSTDDRPRPDVAETGMPTDIDRTEPDPEAAETETSPVLENLPDNPTERSQPAQNSSTRLDSWVKSVTGTVVGVGETVANTGSAIAQSAMNVGETLVKVSTSVTDTAAGVGETVANTGSAIANSAMNVGETLVKVSTSVTDTAAGVGETVANTGNAIAQSAMNVGETLVKVSTSVTDTAAGVGKATANTGSAIAQSAMNVGETLVKVPTEMGVTVAKSVTDTIATTGNTIANSAATVGKNLGKVPKEIGSTFNLVRRNPLLQKLTKSFKLDALLSVLAAVDIAQAEAEVRALQQQYPDEKPDEIAHRIILSKTLLVAGSGLASSLIPGAALALAGVDLATTTMLSAELVYQIAAAYGMDLQSIDRQGEALAILGLSTGGNLAFQAGINLVGTVPVAGAVINASASAAMMYALGYGACRFYEANLNSQISETNLEVFEEILQTEAEEYLEQAIAQNKLMDWILAHMVLAGNPEKTWEALLPELEAAHFSPASLAEISANIQHPPSVEMLLEQIDRDFAIVLLERCQAIANLDGKITPEEARILDLISQKTQQKIQEAEVEQNSPVPTADETFVSPTTRKSLGTVLLETLKDILTRDTQFDRQEIGYLVERVDLMSGEQFEEFLAECFQGLGYDVKTTPKTNDFGADLILTKGGTKTVVQAKRYQGKVGNSAVQEVVAAIQYYGAQEAIVVTNSQFTTNACGLAKANNVQLWEREQLIDLILRAQR